MRPKRHLIEDFLRWHVVLWLRLAGLVSIISGLLGGFVWLNDIEDRSDGDILRYGYWHNPFMQFPPFNEMFLDVSMWVLFACSAAAGLGGILLLVPWKWGAALVSWQARVSVIVNSVIAFCIVVMMFVFVTDQWDEWHLGGTRAALVLRMGSIVVDLALWGFLRSKMVAEFFEQQRHPAARAFEVVMKEASETR